MATNNKIQIEIEVSGERALSTLNLTDENLRNLAGTVKQGEKASQDFRIDSFPSSVSGTSCVGLSYPNKPPQPSTRPYLRLYRCFLF
jgi:hypothetical protein